MVTTSIVFWISRNAGPPRRLPGVRSKALASARPGSSAAVPRAASTAAPIAARRSSQTRGTGAPRGSARPHEVHRGDLEPTARSRRGTRGPIEDRRRRPPLPRPASRTRWQANTSCPDAGSLNSSARRCRARRERVVRLGARRGTRSTTARGFGTCCRTATANAASNSPARRAGGRVAAASSAARPARAWPGGRPAAAAGPGRCRRNARRRAAGTTRSARPSRRRIPRRGRARPPAAAAPPAGRR